MLAYAADRRPAAKPHPKTLALIVAGHAGLLFAVITARGDIVARPPFETTEVTLVDPLEPPPPPPPPSDPKPVQPTESHVFVPETQVPIPLPDPTGPVDVGPPLATPGTGTGEVAIPEPIPVPVPVPTQHVSVAARSLTASSDLVPPYPDDMGRIGKEAVVRLSLSIDPRGRVTEIRALSTADPSFVEAARKHILKRWKYRPATEDGNAVASTVNVSIRFRIDG